jgi:hypothetical protein
MANKPLPQLRKPNAATAASFVEDHPVAAPPALEVVRSEDAPKARGKAPRAAKEEASASRRRMTLYLSTTTARLLRLESANRDRDMSDIVEEVLAKHLKP